MRRPGLVVAANESTCPKGMWDLCCPDQGSNPCPLPWKVDSQPLDHQGSPHQLSFSFMFLYFSFLNVLLGYFSNLLCHFFQVSTYCRFYLFFFKHKYFITCLWLFQDGKPFGVCLYSFILFFCCCVFPMVTSCDLIVIAFSVFLVH